MTYEQLEKALEQLKEWHQEEKECRADTYDPHNYNRDRLNEIARLKQQEIP